jgi:uncharacterized membrane protein
MGKSRLEAFSDGVIAIIITIMVLELRAPHADATLHALRPLLPRFISYVLSFIYIGIYWNNHHHLMHASQRVSGPVLWANMHLLFWLSLVPFTTDWMGESRFAAVPVATYGVILLLAGVAFWVLTHALIRLHGPDSILARAVGNDRKGKASVLIYALGVLSVLINPWVGFAIYAIVAMIWFIPDRRIARRLAHEKVVAAHHDAPPSS